MHGIFYKKKALESFKDFVVTIVEFFLLNAIIS